MQGNIRPPFKFARRIVSVSIQDWVNSFNFLSNLILIQLRLGEINTKLNNLHVRKGERAKITRVKKSFIQYSYVDQYI